MPASKTTRKKTTGRRCVKKKVTKLRCDDCLHLFPIARLNDKFLCMKCRIARLKPKGVRRPKKRWYVVATLPGKERRFRTRLKRKAKLVNQEKWIGRLIVTRHKCVEMIMSGPDEGKHVIRRRKKYPGYILIHMSHFPETDRLVRETPGFMSFLPFYDLNMLSTDTEGHQIDRENIVYPPPTPLTNQEIETILKLEKENQKREPAKIFSGYKIGDLVNVTDGTFAQMQGPVIAVEGEGSACPIVTVQLKVMGCTVDVRLKTHQLKPLA